MADVSYFKAYNARMKNALRPLLAAALAVLPLAAAIAQTQAPATSAASPSAATKAVATKPGLVNSEQTMERITTEDAGARIDELRVGGETKKIVVQPKTKVPAYEIKPAEGARGTAPAAAGADTNGSRVWNALKF